MDRLDEFDVWLRHQYSDMNVTKSSSSEGVPFLIAWLNNLDHEMRYLPSFYIVIESKDQSLFSLKAITFNAKEVGETTSLINSPDLLKFLEDFRNLKLCKGIKTPDADLQFNSETFSRIYLVERFGEQSIVLRSQSCVYALPDSCDICVKCKLLDVQNQTEDGWRENADQEFIEPVVDINEDVRPVQNVAVKTTIMSLVGPELVEDVNHDGVTEFIEMTGDFGDLFEYPKEEVLEVKKPKTPPKVPRKNPVFKKKEPVYRKLCSICYLVFKSEHEYEEDLQRHAESRTANEIVNCPSCLVAVPKVELNNHFDKDHGELKAACCLECFKFFFS